MYLKGAPQRVLCYVTEVGGGTVILLITPRPIDVHCLNILKLWCPSWPLSIVKASKKLEDRTPYVNIKHCFALVTWIVVSLKHVI